MLNFTLVHDFVARKGHAHLTILPLPYLHSEVSMLALMALHKSSPVRVICVQQCHEHMCLPD